jgi:type I restriction enzyme S subunit
MKCKLGEVARFIDYRGKTPPKTTHGIPLVTAKIVKDNVIQPPTEFITADYFDEWMRRGMPKKGDVVFTTEAPLGEVAQIKTSDKLAFAQRIIILQGEENKLDNDFLFYLLQYEPMRERIRARSTGTTVIGIKAAELRQVEINLPDLSTQRTIAATLSALDARIAINKKINHHLEKMVQTVFERLIIEDAANEPLCVLSDIAEINPFRSLSKGKDAVYIEMANLPTRGSFPMNWVARPFSGGMKFKNGDTIMARITPCLENGKTAYINFLGESEIAFGSTEYIVIAPKPGYCNEMFYFLARYQDFVNYAVKNMNGSSGRQRVSGASVGAYELHTPLNEAVNEFTDIARPIMETITHNALENRNLATLRDSLLPRLMSGEMSVADIADTKVSN